MYFIAIVPWFKIGSYAWEWSLYYERHKSENVSNEAYGSADRDCQSTGMVV